MLNEKDLRNAKEKIAFVEQVYNPSEDGRKIETVFDIAQDVLHQTFKAIFDTVLPHELTYDEILAFAEEQLQKVYDEFGEAMSDGIESD